MIGLLQVKLLKVLVMIYSLMMIIFVNEDSYKVTFLNNELCIVSVDLININLDAVNFD